MPTTARQTAINARHVRDLSPCLHSIEGVCKADPIQDSITYPQEAVQLLQGVANRRAPSREREALASTV